jgi:hypothetical protein
MSDMIVRLRGPRVGNLEYAGKTYQPDSNGNYEIPEEVVRELHRYVPIEDAGVLQQSGQITEEMIGQEVFDVEADAKKIVTQLGETMLAQTPSLAAAGFPWARVALERALTTGQILLFVPVDTRSYLLPSEGTIDLGDDVVGIGSVSNTTPDPSTEMNEVAEITDAESHYTRVGSVLTFHLDRVSDTIEIICSKRIHGYDGLTVQWVEGNYQPVTLVGGRWYGILAGVWAPIVDLDAVTIPE